jgi:hypothetical protein
VTVLANAVSQEGDHGIGGLVEPANSRIASRTLFQVVGNLIGQVLGELAQHIGPQLFRVRAGLIRHEILRIVKRRSLDDTPY